MFVNNLLLVSAVGIAAGLLMVAFYYRVIVEPLIHHDRVEQVWDHQPTLDDDMIAITHSMYLDHEFVHYRNPLLEPDRQNLH